MATIDDEFVGSDLGDERLDIRLLQTVQALARDPELSFPEALGDGPALEGAYRLLSNASVEAVAMLRPHILATAARLPKDKPVLIVHDTTEFAPTGTIPRDGLGDHGRFWGHFSLAVTADGRREPLGLLALKTWTRLVPKGKRTTSQRLAEGNLESQRWLTASIEAEAQSAGTPLIHVEDREADIFDSFEQRIARGMRFIVRAQSHRKVKAENNDGLEGIRDRLRSLPRSFHRDVVLSRRQLRGGMKSTYQSRDGRSARLAFAACTIEIRRPLRSDDDVTPFLKLNAVHVIEADPPEDEEVVEWLLLTTEPISTETEIAFVVDSYRARWTIEEYFKSLKSGCAYESRQLGTYEGMLRALSIFAVIAWRLLHMRTLARDEENAPATPHLSDVELEVLQAQGLSDSATLSQALSAIARLGGHLKNNGAPGWEVIWRGFRTLRIMVSGFLLARQRCDQW